MMTDVEWIFDRMKTSMKTVYNMWSKLRWVCVVLRVLHEIRNGFFCWKSLFTWNAFGFSINRPNQNGLRSASQQTGAAFWSHLTDKPDSPIFRTTSAKWIGPNMSVNGSTSMQRTFARYKFNWKFVRPLESKDRHSRDLAKFHKYLTTE